MLVIVPHILGPLHHFLNWAQKRIKQVNRLRKEFAEVGKRYLGPTMLSDLVNGKAAYIARMFDKLLGDVAEVNLLIPAFKYVGAGFYSGAWLLIIEGILTAACLW